MEIITLKGVVLSKYGSVQKFAQAIGWNRNKAIRILNGIQRITAKDIDEIASILDISSSDTFMQLFFARLFTTRIKKQASQP